MPNPFYNPNSSQFSGENPIMQAMREAFNQGTQNFVNNIIRNNPAAKNIYDSMMRSGDPKKFYIDMMKSRGMTEQQAVEFAHKNGVKL